MSLESFEEFLAPTAQSQFLNCTFGNTPEHIPGAPNRFAYLMSWSDLNGILFRHRLEPPRLRLAKLGKAVDKSAFMIAPPNTRIPISRLDISVLNRQFREGAMLVIDSVDEMHAPITELCRILENTLGNYVQANAYAGWYSTKGFDTHWDDHDVFIAQVSGRKHWRVFEPARKHPVTEDRNADLTPPANAYWEGDLAAGDLLYIPRGWWHDAVPIGEPTLHLTFSIVRDTGLDLAKAIVERLRDCEAARRDLPRFGSEESRLAYMAVFRQAVLDILDGFSVSDFLRAQDERAPARSRPSFPWTALPECSPLPSSARVDWLPPRAVAIRDGESNVSLDALGSSFGFAKVAAPLIRDIAARRRVRLDELCRKYPNADVERFARKLVAAGLIAIETDPEP